MPHPDSQETPAIVVTGSHTPEKLEAMRQAAGEVAGGIVVRTYDASNPEERAAYANLIATLELQHYHKRYEYSDGPKHPRTPAEIDKQVIEYAVRKGYALVAIERHEPGDMGDFWRRTTQIEATDPEQP